MLRGVLCQPGHVRRRSVQAACLVNCRALSGNKCLSGRLDGHGMLPVEKWGGGGVVRQDETNWGGACGAMYLCVVHIDQWLI